MLRVDVATGGLRVKGIKHKHEVGVHFGGYIAGESLHQGEMHVTVGADHSKPVYGATHCGIGLGR